MQSTELIVRVIIKRGSKVLLCKSNEEGQGHYFLPGGHVEFGYSLVDTIFKELKEEMGLEKNQITNIKYKNFLENTYGEGDNKHHELNMIFSADVDNQVEILSQESHIEFEWVETSEVQNINFLPRTMIPLL